MWDLEAAVELLRTLGERLDGAKRLDLGQREIRGELALFGEAVDDRDAATARELRPCRHICGRDHIGLVARDEVTVLRRDEVGLDVVGAELDGQRVALQRVVGQVAGRAAVADDERLVGYREA
jgi:hypothetical protein